MVWLNVGQGGNMTLIVRDVAGKNKRRVNGPWEGWQGLLSGSNKLGRVASGKLDALVGSNKLGRVLSGKLDASP